MKTESTVQETVKIERRKLFWRLYSLPWIISTIVLLLICLVFGWIIWDVKQSSLKREEEIRIAGMEYGEKMTFQTAVDLGYGTWTVDKLGKVQFNWSAEPFETNVLPKVLTLEQKSLTLEQEFLTLEPIEHKREFKFGKADYKMAQDLGMDIEGSIVGSVRVKIQQICESSSENIGRLELETKLKDETESAIHREFDGFETYHKIK